MGFLVVLLCVSFAVSSGYRKVGEETFLNQLVDPATGEIDENLVKDVALPVCSLTSNSFACIKSLLQKHFT